MQTKWSQIQSILEKSLASGHYKVWIAPLDPLWENGGLTLQAQNEFVADFIRARLMPAITSAVHEIMGTDFPVVIQKRTRPLAVSSLSKYDAKNAPNEVLPQLHCEADNGVPATVNISLSAVTPEKNTAVAVASESAESLASVRSCPAPRPLSSVQLALPIQAPEKTATAKSERVWRHSFEDFVVGPCNELAYAASRSVSGQSQCGDMLFLSSAPGLGKTHLMQAVGQKLAESCNRKTPRVEYLTAEEFATRFYFSLKGNSTDQFKARYRDADLFLLEDVHFLQGKEKMQAELLATVKALQDRGSKIVFTSSFAPRDLRQMDDQLHSRLSAGFMAYIDKPDQETRRRILRHKASIHQVLLPEDVESVLASHIHADVRQIESCLKNLILKAKLLNSGITMQMAWEVIGNYASHSPILDMDSIIVHVCQGFGLTQEQLFSSRRKQEYVSARNTAFYLARKHTDLSLDAIGRQFNRKHSTVLKGITNLEREMSRKTPVGRQISNTLTMIERNGNLVASTASAGR